MSRHWLSYCLTGICIVLVLAWWAALAWGAAEALL